MAIPILPWIAHLYTASGILIAFLATGQVFAHDFRAAFLLMVLATAIDATDGWLARLVRVKERVPRIDGASMDTIIDYITYTFIPALVVWQAGVVPGAFVAGNTLLIPWAFPVCAAMLIASLYNFTHAEAKVERDGEHFFTGFPSYWNIVVAYLYLAGMAPAVNAGVLIALAVLVFVPIRYVYPSRMKTLQRPTLALGTMWSLLFAWMIWRLPATDGPWLMLSLIFPVYYVALSLWLQAGGRAGKD